MHAWLHKTEFRVRGRYMIFLLVWICLDLVYQFNWMLTIWHEQTLVLIFLYPFESSSNPRFVDEDLNKLKTWIWKSKHVCVLISHSKMKLLGGFLKFPCLKPKTTYLHALDFMRQSLGLGGRYMICLVWICLDLVYQLECLLYDIKRPCALIFHFF